MPKKPNKPIPSDFVDSTADEFFSRKEDLLSRLQNDSKVFKNKAIKEAFQEIDRRDFVTDDYKVEAYEDYPLPTLHGQTMSQPTTVAFMLELLDPKKDDVVLDIGAGTGWTAALLAHMVGKNGKVVGLEILPDLVAFAKKNLKKYNDLPVEIFQAVKKEIGLYTQAPFNRIISGATFPNKETAPVDLLLQLAPGGVMVIPIGDSIFKFEKVSDQDFYETEYPGFVFVPYVE